ncbi:hypothetical protein [Streptomyces sp. CBMA123]|uniref:hypothetical protein n=1 Tax=Streptomyces sp. CBMA123 TaxID=1896313 RepID=UPI001661BB83|nr:hypothetical protein [Streptomyces sp. CBMA123]MBD0695811.1 hypothetical protein [Streptomyces sp. CBMA123]
MIRRAGWAQITERTDQLAYQAALYAQRWDGGADWPSGEICELYPQSSAPAAEFAKRLEPAPVDRPLTVLQRWVLSDRDEGELLHDPATGLPVVRTESARGRVTLFAPASQRLPTTSRLSEVIFSYGTVWVRTDDGGLWLAPQVPGEGLGYSQGGGTGGTSALAQLLNRLLDDITAPAVRYDQDTPPKGLVKLVRNAPENTMSAFSRADLEMARAAG